MLDAPWWRSRAASCARTSQRRRRPAGSDRCRSSPPSRTGTGLALAARAHGRTLRGETAQLGWLALVLRPGSQLAATATAPTMHVAQARDGRRLRARSRRGGAAPQLREGDARDGATPSRARAAAYRHRALGRVLSRARLRSIDPARARAELRTVLRSVRADGFLPTRSSGTRPRLAPRAAVLEARVLGDRHTEDDRPAAAGVAGSSSPTRRDEPGFRRRGPGGCAPWLARARARPLTATAGSIAYPTSPASTTRRRLAGLRRPDPRRAGYALLVERCLLARWDSHALIARYAIT